MEHTITDWRNRAACNGSEPEMWFAYPATDEYEMAREICEGCPVRLACGVFAYRTRQTAGIWAGFDVDRGRKGFRSWLVARGVVKAPPTCQECGEELPGTGPSTRCGLCKAGMVPAAPYVAYIADLLASGWTMAEIARRTGAPYSAISKLKRKGDRITRAAAEQLDASRAVIA